MKDRIKKFLQENKVWIILLGLIAVCVLLPTLRTGIIQNDELQHRLYSTDIINGYKHYINTLANGGRLLGTISIPIIYIFAFLSSSPIWFDGLGALAILSNVVLFGILIKTLTKNKNLAFLSCTLFLIFMQFSFEPTVPNTFNFIFGLIISFMLISFLLFNKYLHNNKKTYLIISMILFFISLTVYEMVLVYSVFYVILILLKTRNIREIIHKSTIPFIVSIIYLILYVITSKVAPSNYAGNSIDISSIPNIIRAIIGMVAGSFPGVLLFSAKNQYLFNIYSNQADFWSSILNNINIKIIFISIASFVLLKNTLKYKKIKESHMQIIACILIPIIFIILPTLPQSLTPMYQGVFMNGGFNIMSVSYFVSFATTFLISYIIYILFTNKKILSIILTFLIILYTIPIQAMNKVFINVQESEYNRLVEIEEVLQTDTALKYLENKSVYTPEIYETRIAMGIHETYWTQYLNYKHNIHINTSSSIGNTDISMFYNDEIFSIVTHNNIIVLVPDEPIYGKHMVKISDEEELELEFLDYTKDRGFYVYIFENRG